MVNKTAAFATLLTLGGAANGGMAQESMAQEGQVPASENNQILAETRTDTDSSPLREQTADSALEPQCYYNYIHFDRDGYCGEKRRECYRVAGASYSLFPLKERAVMDSFLDGGKGGVVVNQYVISDENAFAMAAGNRDFQQAMAQFQAKANGVNSQIKTLDDVKACLEEEKKTRKRGILQKWADSLGLSAAIEAKNAVAEINASNRSDTVLAHEGTHWQDNDILSGIQTGKLMVKPEHHYALKMISEMKARMAEAKVQGKDAAQGLATFEQECLDEYRTEFTQDARGRFGNAVRRRQLALAMDSPGMQKVVQPTYPDDVKYVPNNDVQDGWVQMAFYSTPEQKYCVYFRPDSVAQNVTQFTDKFNEVHPFNVLLDEKKEPIKDKNGNMIAVTPDSYTPAGDAVIALEGVKPSYGDETMRINYRLAMRKMLQPLSSEERQLVVDKLNSSAYQPVQNLEIRQNLASDDITSLREETWLDGMPKEECMARALDGSVKRMEREYMQQSADKAQSYVAVSPQGEAIKKTMTAEAFLQKAQAMRHEH